MIRRLADYTMDELPTPRTRALLVATFGRDLGGLAHAYFRPKRRPNTYFLAWDDRLACLAAYAACRDGCFELLNNLAYLPPTVRIHMAYGACKGDYPALIDKQLVGCRDPSMLNHALAAACRVGNIALARKILALGPTDATCALAAACRGGHVEAARFVMASGLPFDMDEAICDACRKNKANMIRFMIECGATECACGKSLEDHYAALMPV